MTSFAFKVHPYYMTVHNSRQIGYADHSIVQTNCKIGLVDHSVVQISCQIGSIPGLVARETNINIFVACVSLEQNIQRSHCNSISCFL